MDERESDGSPTPSEGHAPVGGEKADEAIPAEVSAAPPSEPAAWDAAPADPIVPEEVERAPVSPRIRLDKKHPLAIRWMHWINFPVLFTRIWSGLLIYWNDSDNAYKHPHAVYRIGVGPFTLIRFFPQIGRAHV